MMKATAEAPANIAFIKYWGKADEELRLPLNGSISMNLSETYTVTTVEFSNKFSADSVSEGFDNKRILDHVDRLRKIAGSEEKVKVITENNFPKSAGIASSASGFAALTVAGTAALGLKLSEKELSALARLGSGSACRSIPDGFVKWENSFAYSLYPPEYWDLRDILVIVENNVKDVSSSVGHEGAYTSPFFTKRLQQVPKRISRLEAALAKKDFQKLGGVIEEDCLDMHHVMQTQNQQLFYWNDTTKAIMSAVMGWRKQGIPVYFTIDAGPNVHLICEGKDEERAIQAIKAIKGIKEIIINKPAEGARLVY